ncbi:MAG: cysteine desulfurase [Alphaproteobacteria bacterium]|nr:cysteine desulfurase [Alphaproteobacteria bacterium]
MADFDQIRTNFPVLATEMNGKPLAFLDSAASAQKPQAVINAMNDVLTSGYSNIHRGLYSISQQLTADFEDVRRKVAGFINASSDKEIVFTRNSTESINLVAQSWARAHLEEGDEVILTEMEHHANIVPWQILERQIGIQINVVPVFDDGSLDMESFETLLSEKTKLVSVVHISNATGIVNPVNKIIEIARDFNPKIKVLIDGSQGVVHGKVDVQALDCDFYVFTGHKLYGPSGIGVLYGKYDILDSMPPYQGGGDMIEKVSFDGTTFKEPPYRFEAGTPAIVEVIGLGAAIDYVSAIGFDALEKRENALRDYGHERLKEIEGLKLYGTTRDKIGIFSFTLEDIHTSDAGMILDQCGVAVRSGHHCCMPLMHRYGIEGTIRASLGLYSNEDDINQLIDGLKKVKELFG